MNELLDRHLYRMLFDDPTASQRGFELLTGDFYAAYPRQVMARAIAASATRASMWMDGDSLRQFQAWVKSQNQPAPRDLIRLWDARLRELMATGAYEKAVGTADAVSSLVRSHPVDTDAFDDVAPAPLIHCGVAYLTAGDTDSALRSFREAEQWATLRGEHPITRYAREHSALAHALSSRHREATTLLGPHDEARRLAPDGRSLHLYYRSAGVLARALITIGALDMDATESSLRSLAHPAEYGELGWFVLLARGKAAWWSEDPFAAIQDIESYLVDERSRTSPHTAPGTSLRAELASLYQISGDLRLSALTLQTPDLVRGHAGLVGPSMRQQLLLGRPRRALAILRDQEVRSVTPVQATPWGALMHGVVEQALTGALRDESARAIATAMNYHRAYFPLLQAPVPVRQQVLPLLDTDLRHIPSPFRYRGAVSLTPRERDMLRALSTGRTLDQIAIDLHLSANTVKTHTRVLYRKLGVRSREEALFVGDQYLI